MLRRFTSTARTVVTRAVEEASLMGQPKVGTEHLLLALTAIDTGPARRILAEFGVNEPRVRGVVVGRGPAAAGVFSDEDAKALASVGIDLEEVLARIKDQLGDQPKPPSGRAWRTTMTPHAKKALQLSLREAIWLKDGSIGSEHILLGILRAGDGLACSVLDEIGVSRDELRRAVLRATTEAA